MAAALGSALALSVAATPSLAAAARPRAAAKASHRDGHFRDGAGAVEVAALPAKIRKGLQRQHERHDDAEVEQYREAVEWLLEGAVLVRLELFANARREGIAAWLDGSMRPLALVADSIDSVDVLGSTGARLLTFARSSQAPSRRVLLVAAPRVRLRLSCEDSDAPKAAALFTVIRAGLRLLPAPKATP